LSADRAAELAAGTAGPVPVLMYHSIGTRSTARFRRFTVDPAEFADQMGYLAADGYTPVTAADLAEHRLTGRPLPARPVVLTFDDGFTDFADAALPVLQAHGFPATLFVPTGYVGATARFLSDCGEEHRPVLSWSQLRDLAADGVEVASHSHSHPQLDRVPPADARDEARRSKCLLEDNLGRGVAGFAYPFGYWNRSARAAVAAAGFGYGCAVAELVALPGDDMRTLPRMTVNAGIGVAGVSRLLQSGTGARRSAGAKRIAWRAMRRGVKRLGGDPRSGWQVRSLQGIGG
jgi:peptidoglycan/xylan/chitin deacetylase (PgdA/CDA1 family)